MRNKKRKFLSATSQAGMNPEERTENAAKDEAVMNEDQLSEPGAEADESSSVTENRDEEKPSCSGQKEQASTEAGDSPPTPEEKNPEELIKEWQDKYLRLSAEFDNYRKRTLKEKIEWSKLAGEDMLLGLLPIIDDFDRAQQSITEASDIEAVKEGIVLIYNKFMEFLKQRGVAEIESKDKEFNTDLHEAVTKFPVQDENLKGKVVDVIEKGYYLNEKVLRYAKVVIGE